MRLPETFVAELFGQKDEFIKQIKSELSVEAAYTGGELVVTGSSENTLNCEKVLNFLTGILHERPLTRDDVESAVKLVQNGEISDAQEIYKHRIKVAGHIRYVSPKSLAQRSYLQQMKDNDIVFAYGPAGTGKTFLAVAMAVHYYLEKRVNKIVLTRPAVEAGEKLGFLPGDLADKINPYLRPLYDALNAMLDFELVAKLMERGIIEVAPLAFMRGRTLSNAFVILDEAQNTTHAQMKMFLTRIGRGSKAVVTGDITQVDLPKELGSGLINALDILRNVKGIGFVELTEKDVARHPLVARIITAYAKAAEKQVKKDLAGLDPGAASDEGCAQVKHSVEGQA